MEDKKCTSCKIKVANESAVSFNCPKCGKYEIIRCPNCRSNATKYTCPNCEFVGPN